MYGAHLAVLPISSLYAKLAKLSVKKKTNKGVQHVDCSQVRSDITVPVFSLEHHNKYCSRAIAETDQWHFLECHSIATWGIKHAKNMHMGEMILKMYVLCTGVF